MAKDKKSIRKLINLARTITTQPTLILGTIQINLLNSDFKFVINSYTT